MKNIINLNSLEAAQVMRLCFKVFWSSTVYVLPQVQGVDVNLWFQMISDLMNKRLPEASEGIEPFGQPTDPADRKVWPWWKVSEFSFHSGQVLKELSCYCSIVEEVDFTYYDTFHTTLR